uniref:Bm11712 n=1 Tax=Brugia malayi TaxID=6279 RepID=A0A1I9GDN7_BRUMA|nr:Bm11712 [Brugia malayi]
MPRSVWFGREIYIHPDQGKGCVGSEDDFMPQRPPACSQIQSQKTLLRSHVCSSQAGEPLPHASRDCWYFTDQRALPSGKPMIMVGQHPSYSSSWPELLIMDHPLGGWGGCPSTARLPGILEWLVRGADRRQGDGGKREAQASSPTQPARILGEMGLPLPGAEVVHDLGKGVLAPSAVLQLHEQAGHYT